MIKNLSKNEKGTLKSKRGKENLHQTNLKLTQQLSSETLTPRQELIYSILSKVAHMRIDVK